MPNTYTSLSSLFTAIANALRSLKGTSAPIVADNFPSEISGITSKSAQTYTPTTADQTIAAGQYLSGAQTVKGDANLVAGNIKKDVTIFGVTGTHEGGGGTQPTLYPPVVSGGVNRIEWENNSQNGAFGSVSATIDGATVTSPLTVTSEMNGKTLVTTCSETNFQSASSTMQISYMQGNSGIFVNQILTDPNYPNSPILVGLGQLDYCDVTFNGVEYKRSDNPMYNLSLDAHAATSASFNCTLKVAVSYAATFTIKFGNSFGTELMTNVYGNRLGTAYPLPSRYSGYTWSVVLTNVNDPSEVLRYSGTGSGEYSFKIPSDSMGKTYSFIYNLSVPESS